MHSLYLVQILKWQLHSIGPQEADVPEEMHTNQSIRMEGVQGFLLI